MKKLIPSLLVAFGLIGGASAASLTGDLTNGLVAYYRFDGNLNDQTENSVTGVLNGSGISYSTDRFGNLSSAINFQGGGYVSLSTVPISLNRDFTISFWCYGDPAGNGSRLGGGPTDRVDNLISTGLEGSGGLNIRFTSFQSPRWQCFSGNVENVANPFIGSDSPEYVSNWNLITYVQDGNTTVLYINGLKAGEMSNTPTATSLGSLWIGRHNGAGDDSSGYYDTVGKISDLGFYDRALSSADVSSLYSLQSIPEPSTYALFGIGALALVIAYGRKVA